MTFYKWLNGILQFDSGTPIAASDFNGSIQNTVAPIGSIAAFLKSFTGAPSVPSGWVECNGQVLSDADSPINGQTIPNLNNSGGAAANRYLRGATSSGATGGATTNSHTETINTSSYYTGANANSAAPCSGDHYHTITYTTDTVASEPPYYSVVWLMRIK